jgi:hypothetical protein
VCSAIRRGFLRACDTTGHEAVFCDAYRDRAQCALPKAKGMSKEAKTIGIVGTGIIVVAVASCLQRHSHEVFVMDSPCSKL